MLRPRGCLFGVGGIVVALILVCAVAYFVALPRFHQQVEDELTGMLATEVAGVLDSGNAGVGSLQPGEYRIPLSDVERQLSGGSENLQVEGVTLRADGADLIVAFAVSNAETSYRFTPDVSPEGYLRMTDMRGDGGVVERLLSPESIGNAIENSVNGNLQANGLYLQDVTMSDADLVLLVGER